MSCSDPLVSIIVITYNSAEFVLETLESAQAQTYRNVELIVSDDCSPDNTVEVCRDWMGRHKDRFVRAELLTADQNTGIAPNCNRGVQAARGEWVKTIAGDDVLLDDCIETFVKSVCRQPGTHLACCGILPFGDGQTYQPYFPPAWFLRLSADRQLTTLLRKGTFIPGPAMFFERETLCRLGMFNEAYPFMEDYPFYVKAAKKGYRFFLIPKPLVRYRVHPGSVTHKSNSPSVVSWHRYFRNEMIPLLRAKKMVFSYWHHVLSDCLLVRREKNRVLKHIWVRRGILLLDPIYLLDLAYRLVGSSYEHRLRFKREAPDLTHTRAG